MKYAWLLVPVALLIVFAIAAGRVVEPRASRFQRSTAVVQLLAEGCNAYTALDQGYPDPNPDATELGGVREFREKYYRSGAWTDEGLNVSLVWLLSVPRYPEPFLDLNQKWFEPVLRPIHGPDGRFLYRCVDGFGHPIRVRRIPGSPAEMLITSAGPDGDFATAKDNIEIRLKR